MLIRFSVENYRCFRDRVELSLIAGPSGENRSLHVVGPFGTPHVEVLKAAVLYGANASGKSNLVRAIFTAQQMIKHPSDAKAKLAMIPFKLDPAFRHKPSRFEFEIKVGTRLLAYGFVADTDRVHEEWLIDVTGAEDSPLFTRTDKEVVFGPELRGVSDEQQHFLSFLGKSTLANRLFLAECLERNVIENVASAAILGEVLDWFIQKLVVILPTSQYSSLHRQVADEVNFRTKLSHILSSFDTGIKDVRLAEVGQDELASLPEMGIAELESQVNAEGSVLVPRSPTLIWLVDRHENQKLRARRLVFEHGTGNEISDVLFELADESEGTRRLLDLAPALMMLVRKDRVVVIDELDRSLHPEITHSFLANFLRRSVGLESQLIVTTHESSLLLKQGLLRRDEIWLVQKDKQQVSGLIALEEYKQVETDQPDLQADYLNGRFQGVPVIHDFSWMGPKNAAGA